MIQKPYLWAMPITRGIDCDNTLNAPIYYNDNVLIGFDDNNSHHYFRMVNSKNGRIVWERPYYFQYKFRIYEAYLYNNLAVIQEFCRPRYCIDMNTGDMKWGYKDYKEDLYNNISGIDSLFFICETPFDGKPDSGSIGRGFYGNIEDGLVYPYVTPDFRGDTSMTPIYYSIGEMYRIIPFKNDTGAILQVILYEKFFPDYTSKALLGLYNFSERKWIYDNAVIREASLSSRPMPKPIIYKGNIYGICGAQIWCAELYTGKIKWQKNYVCVFESTDFALVDDKVIAIDCYDELVALDVNTGREVWENLECSSNTSNMIVLNGILYFASMGNGRLHAVEVATGKLLWKLKMPDYKDASLQPELTIIPGNNGEKGRIIVRSFLNAYCFEAER